MCYIHEWNVLPHFGYWRISMGIHPTPTHQKEIIIKTKIIKSNKPVKMYSIYPFCLAKNVVNKALHVLSSLSSNLISFTYLRYIIRYMFSLRGWRERERKKINRSWEYETKSMTFIAAGSSWTRLGTLCTQNSRSLLNVLELIMFIKIPPVFFVFFVRFVLKLLDFIYYSTGFIIEFTFF